MQKHQNDIFAPTTVVLDKGAWKSTRKKHITANIDIKDQTAVICFTVFYNTAKLASGDKGGGRGGGVRLITAIQKTGSL